MINVSEALKNIMREYNLNQSQLSRAVNCDYSTISRYISGTRKPDLETLEYILNPFGYELNIGRVKNPETAKSKSFYMEKTYEQLKLMTQEELVDYVFVTQDEDVLANISGVPNSILEYMPLEKQREFIREKIEDMNILEVYFRICKMHKGIEWEMACFVEQIKYHLENISKISKEVLAEAEYLMFDAQVCNHVSGNKCYTIDNFRLLDKNRTLLDAISDDIENWEEEPLENLMDCIIGDYYFDKTDGVNIEIELNY